MEHRTVGILIYDEVEVLDFAGPFEVFAVTTQLLEHRPFTVQTIAPRAATVRAVNGLRVVPDRAFAAEPPPQVLIVPGGDGSRVQMQNPDLVAWVAQAYTQGGIVMSVCSGVRLLAKAGLLSGRKATTHHEVFPDLRALAPDALFCPDQRITDNGRVLTTGGISAGIDGSLYLVQRLLGAEAARRTATYMEYDWQPEAALQNRVWT